MGATTTSFLFDHFRRERERREGGGGKERLGENSQGTPCISSRQRPSTKLAVRPQQGYSQSARCIGPCLVRESLSLRFAPTQQPNGPPTFTVEHPPPILFAKSLSKDTFIYKISFFILQARFLDHRFTHKNYGSFYPYFVQKIPFKKRRIQSFSIFCLQTRFLYVLFTRYDTKKYDPFYILFIDKISRVPESRFNFYT